MIIYVFSGAWEYHKVLLHVIRLDEYNEMKKSHFFVVGFFPMRMLGMHSDAKVIGQAVANIWKMPKNKREIINFCSKWFSLICRRVVNNQQNVIPPMIFWINGDFNSHLNVSCHMDKAQFYNTHELFSLFAGFFCQFRKSFGVQIAIVYLQ